MEDCFYPSNKMLIHYIDEYEKFQNSLEENFPKDSKFITFAKAWLEKAQAFARKNGWFFIPPSVMNTKEGDGIVLIWESNPFFPIYYHDYAFFEDGKAGYYNRDITEIIDYSDPKTWFNHEFVPFENTVRAFSIPFEMAKLNNAA